MAQCQGSAWPNSSRRRSLGEDIILARDYKPLLKLVPLKDLTANAVARAPRRAEVRMSPDFDAPLDDFADYQ